MAEVKQSKNKNQDETEESSVKLTDDSKTELLTAVSTPSTEESKPLAKAGKRSPKALKEVEEKQEKEARKSDSSTQKELDQTVPKNVTKVRSLLERRSKNFREAAKLIDADKSYSVSEAMNLACKTSPVKFDATAEMHLRLNVDPRQADQNIRDIVVLPAGTGKTVRVAVFADVDDVEKAKAAGADIAGGDEFLALLEKGELEFDVLIATPSQMPKLGKHARVLGPKGLMPNPKSGTVTTNVAKAITEAKAGRVEYRVDSTGIIHVGIGKVSFGGAKLTDNARAILNSVKGNKPSSIKGALIRSAFVTTSMGPSIKLDITDL